MRAVRKASEKYDQAQDVVIITGFSNDACLIDALHRGDESAFVWLLDRYHTSMVMLARAYVPSREAAEEVVQETWMCVLQGLDRFEGRSSLKTWIFHILTNRAKTLGQREGRSVPFSALHEVGVEPYEPAVDSERFREADPWRHHWSSVPRSWNETPEDCLLTEEIRKYIEAAIEALPPSQHAVIVLRDIEGLAAVETCNILGITETNHRVLLHRARSKVRNMLEQYMGEE